MILKTALGEILMLFFARMSRVESILSRACACTKAIESMHSTSNANEEDKVSSLLIRRCIKIYLLQIIKQSMYGRIESDMRQVVLYLKCSKDIEVFEEAVFMKDVASIECEDAEVCARCRAIKVHQFQERSTRTVVSITKLIQLICKECPGVLVQSVGETDVLIEKVQPDKGKGPAMWLKVVLVCLVSFFGTAFTLIAFNNDVGITDVFERLYLVVMNEEAGAVNVLEISYAIGLAAGIIIFFNHVGGRRITKDPTPIEVSMRNYERDVNQALIETADREGKEEDV